jgi:hypothetical protein
MRLRRCWPFAAWALLVVACGGKSPAERVAEHDRTRASWEQTARFVGTAWERGAVPAAYARRTLATTLEELAKEDRAIATEPLTEAERLRLRRALDRSRALGQSLASAVGAGSRSRK